MVRGRRTVPRNAEAELAPVSRGAGGGSGNLSAARDRMICNLLGSDSYKLDPYRDSLDLYLQRFSQSPRWPLHG